MNRRRFLGAAAAASASLSALAQRTAASVRPAIDRPIQGPRSIARAPIRVDGRRLESRLSGLAQFGRNSDGGIDRVAYSDADVEARRWVMGLMREAGLDVRVDTAGNIIGRRAGSAGPRGALMTGSHIDSVPGGGNFDGQVGSMGAIEAAHALADAGITLSHPLEIVIFQNEENGKVGSKAMRGEDPATYLDLMTHSGRTIREGIRFIGGDPDRLAEARRAPGDIAAFIELHVEQGGILDRAGLDIGVVEGIVGIKRWAITVDGFANHAGTTPMDQRQDALLAAARFIDAVNGVAVRAPGRHVATVGAVQAEPGAPNVIAGRVRLTLEMRDLDLDRVDGLFETTRREAAAIAQATGTRFEFEPIYRTMPATTDEALRNVIESRAHELGLTTMRMPSGAGHDAQEIASLAPMGMIFVPSIGGISHSPLEKSLPAAIENGANVLVNSLLALDARPR